MLELLTFVVHSHVRHNIGPRGRFIPWHGEGWGSLTFDAIFVRGRLSCWRSVPSGNTLCVVRQKGCIRI